MNNPLAMIDAAGNAPTLLENIIVLSKNKNGSYSLYDNDRFRDDNSWHEQILVISPSSPNFGPEDGELSIGLGSISADIYTGGWEYENFNLSLFDFGHAEAALTLSKQGLSAGAIVSIWSPSVSFTIFGYTVELGVEVGSVGAKITVGNGFGVKGAALFGISINVSSN